VFDRNFVIGLPIMWQLVRQCAGPVCRPCMLPASQATKPKAVRLCTRETWLLVAEACADTGCRGDQWPHLLGMFPDTNMQYIRFGCIQKYIQGIRVYHLANMHHIIRVSQRWRGLGAPPGKLASYARAAWKQNGQSKIGHSRFVARAVCGRSGSIILLRNAVPRMEGFCNFLPRPPREV
jgi:hypothetical protein